MDGFQDVKVRASDPQLSWLRMICLLLAREPELLADDFTASRLAELSLNREIAIPGMRDGGEDGPRAVGALMGTIFRRFKDESVIVEGFTITRGSWTEKDSESRNRQVHLYRFAIGTAPQPPQLSYM